MKLNLWTSQQRGRSLWLANTLAIAPPVVSDWSTCKKPVPIERCVPIERATGGAVTRRDLRPNDWQDIWPELAETPADAENIQPNHPQALTPPAHAAINPIASQGRTHPPAPAHDAPGHPAGGAAGAQAAQTTYAGPDRRKNLGAPCIHPDLERREPLAAALAGQGG